MKSLFIKIVLIICIAVLAVSLAGCGGDKPPANPETPSTPNAAPTKAAEDTAPVTIAPTPPPTSEEPDEPDEPDYGPEIDFSGLPPVFYSTYYYLGGEDCDTDLYFYDDGEVDLDYPDETLTGEYTVEEYGITIEVDGEQHVSLLMIDMCTLLDENGNVYMVEGANNRELETSSFYYLNADEDAGSVWFYNYGDVDVENPGSETMTYEYTVDGDTITVTYEGNTATMTIYNSYMLLSDEGNWFVRQP